MDPEEFRRVGHALIDWLADYRQHLGDHPVMSRALPGEVAALLPSAPPDQATGFDDLQDDLERIVLPGITHWNAPGFFAYFPSNTDLASVLGDLVSSGLGPQGMSWQTSPAATEVEDVVMDWLRRMVGLPDGFAGVIQDSASTSTLCALLCARERATGFAQEHGGLQGEAAPLVVYASDQAHSSVAKAALLGGFGADNLRLVGTDDEHALRPDLLEAAVAADLAEGRRPCAVVATVGTTATTALDPVAAVADLAAAHGLWLHVDAALAGSAMICPEYRHLWAGVERADSLVFNPHKWLGAGFDLSAYYVRDPAPLLRAMSTDPSYLRTGQDGSVRNLRDWGIPLGRRFRALKLWFLLRDQGVAGLQARIRRDIDNAQWLAAQVQAAPHWRLMAPTPLQTVCLRYEQGEDHEGSARAGEAVADKDPALIDEASAGSLDVLNHRIVDAVNAAGTSYLTSAVVKGRRLIRVSVGAAATQRSDVAAVWCELQEAARQLSAG